MGVWQVHRTAARLAAEHFERVYTSPALRCLRLATAIGSATGAPVTVDRDLRERDYGSLTGERGCELLRLGINGRPEGGESVEDVYRRASCVLDRLRGDNVLIVSHGLFLKMLVCRAVGMTMRSAVRSLKFSNCAISLLDTSAGIVEYLNDRAHLERTASRIHVFGGWAAGKTSVARNLGERLGLPVFHLDNIKYADGFRRVRPVSQRLAMLDEITSGTEWITEGAWTDYAAAAFERADVIFYVESGYLRSLMLAAKREFCRKRPEGVSFLKLVAALTAYRVGSGKVSRKAHEHYFCQNSHKALRMGAASTSAIVQLALAFCRSPAVFNTLDTPVV
jgi:broad specificity phosphatase PhoE